jgi:CHASE2 domain-containing sensor protein
MAFDKKQLIRGIRILLTVFYGFLLSSTLFRYVIHGIVETIRRPTNPYAITMVAIGGIIFISIILATYATWYEMIEKYSYKKILFYLGLIIKLYY